MLAVNLEAAREQIDLSRHNRALPECDPEWGKGCRKRGVLDVILNCSTLAGCTAVLADAVVDKARIMLDAPVVRHNSKRPVGAAGWPWSAR